MIRISTVVGCLVLGAIVASQAAAQDWPQWRGENRDAKVAGFKTPVTWPEELTKKWQVKVGDGVATPALVGDRIFVFARQGDDEVLMCLSAETGDEIWRDSYNVAGADGPASGFAGPRASPAVSGGRVFTFGVRGTVSCNNADNGELLWRHDEEGSFPRFYTSSSPIVVDGKCICQLGGESAGSVVAYDTGTGDEKWKWDGDGTGYASPVLMEVGGKQMLIAETAAKIIALDIATGEAMWEFDYPTGSGRGGAGGRRGGGRGGDARGGNGGGGEFDLQPQQDDQGRQGQGQGRGDAQGRGQGGQQGRGQGRGRGGRGGGGPGYNASTPIPDGQLLIFSGSNRGTKALKLERDGDKINATEVWNNPDNSVIYNSPVLKGNLLFGLTSADNLYCLNAETGETVWTEMYRSPMRGYGSIVDAGDVLFALNTSSKLLVLQPGEEYKELASYQVSEGRTYAYPIISGNRIFIKDDENLTLYTIE